MNYLDKAEREIRNDWFENHVAELNGEGELQILTWRENGTNSYSAKYILSGSDLIVTGDMGKAIYSLPAQLDRIKGMDLNYFTKRLSAHSDARWSFDEQYALEELENWYEEKKSDANHLEDLEEIYTSLKSAIADWSLYEQFQQAVFSIYDNFANDWFDIEEASLISGFGKRLPYEFIAYWVGLQMAITQLEENQKQKA